MQQCSKVLTHSLRSIMDVSPSSSVREISWIIVAMLFAEGYGNFFLAYATWNYINDIRT